MSQQPLATMHFKKTQSVHRVHAMCRSTNMKLKFSRVTVGEQSYVLRSVLMKENTSFGFRLPDSACEEMRHKTVHVCQEPTVLLLCLTAVLHNSWFHLQRLVHCVWVACRGCYRVVSIKITAFSPKCQMR